MNKYTLSAAFLLSLILLSGCARNEFGTVTVTGSVTVDGVPMESISVAFIPNSKEARDCYGMTDGEGKFDLTIPGTEVGSGAMPGEYVVTFSKTTNPASNLSDEEIRRKFPRGRPMDVDVLPKKYADRAQTDIAPVTVEKRGKNEFEFALVTK